MLEFCITAKKLKHIADFKKIILQNQTWIWINAFIKYMQVIKKYPKKFLKLVRHVEGRYKISKILDSESFDFLEVPDISINYIEIKFTFSKM